MIDRVFKAFIFHEDRARSARILDRVVFVLRFESSKNVPGDEVDEELVQIAKATAACEFADPDSLTWGPVLTRRNPSTDNLLMAGSVTTEGAAIRTRVWFLAEYTHGRSKVFFDVSDRDPGVESSAIETWVEFRELDQAQLDDQGLQVYSTERQSVADVENPVSPTSAQIKPNRYISAALTIAIVLLSLCALWLIIF